MTIEKDNTKKNEEDKDILLHSSDAHIPKFLFPWGMLELISKRKHFPSLESIIPLYKDKHRIGRVYSDEDDIDISLGTGNVSRKHATISKISCVIKDNDSLNGLFVNNCRVQSHVLKDGDLIVFGGDPKVAHGKPLVDVTPPTTLKDQLIETTYLTYQFYNCSTRKRKANTDLPDPTPIVKKKLTSTTSKAIHHEFICTICQEIILHSATLFCSHSYCKECIMRWLPNNPHCPICRRCVTGTRLLRNHTLDNLTSALMKYLDDDAQENYAERLQEYKELNQKKLEEIHSLEAAANKNKEEFLNIEESWDKETRDTFQCNIAKYDSLAREQFCALTNLTKGWVRKVNDEYILIASNNLELITHKLPDGSIDYDGLRRDLSDFITGDLLFSPFATPKSSK